MYVYVTIIFSLIGDIYGNITFDIGKYFSYITYIVHLKTCWKTQYATALLQYACIIKCIK